MKAGNKHKIQLVNKKAGEKDKAAQEREMAKLLEQRAGNSPPSPSGRGPG